MHSMLDEMEAIRELCRGIQVEDAGCGAIDYFSATENASSL